ncbi:beta-alanine-activating enzyme isoform X2 [Halyomorpha halys]|uniref:beta-alanine-activating enzyme isoform X2 n=1 Tax=Halyomorpha halys TaxID=286706 RepID=UPI0006D5103B|nr:beta-alanine-activating enzyme isoform X2 [Halyomorpha halys]
MDDIAILQVSNTDVFMLMTAITFDPSVIELFLPLMNGATLCIVEKYVKQNPDLLLDILFPTSGGLVTILQTTPSLFRRWNTTVLQKRVFTAKSMLKNLILGGEEFPSVNELKSWNLIKNINIYNIYGVTEVSCWASIKRVWPAKKIEIDIGIPLCETLFKIETDNQNEGELFIGSKTRKCLINDEAHETVSNKDDILFRATGDIFKKVNGKLFFKRRKDDILKRWGTKFSTSSLEECVKLHKNILACVSTTCKINHHIRIGLFIMEKHSSDLKDLKHFLKKSLPKASWPDSIVVLDSFPLTAHGKICLRSLNKILQEEKKSKSRETFYEMWRHYSSENASGFNDFFSDGGDSLMALQFVEELKQIFNHVPDTILGMILQRKSCDELWTYLADYQGNSTSEQRITLNNLCNETTKSRTINIIKLVQKGKISIFANYKPNGDSCILSDVQLTETWKLNLGKCIDASPLGMELISGEKLCIIGSHSGRVVVLEVNTGRLISECNLPDRVESSACISFNAEIYYIGCYDGCVYAVSSKCGKIIWNFKTEDMVKSTCLIFEDCIIFGSYDRKMYCLFENGFLKWKTLLRSPILADPVLHNNCIYSATLGSIAVLNSGTGQLLWELKHDPIFSTPVLNDSYLIVADVTGLVQWLNIKNGLEEYVFRTDSVIFSSLVKFIMNEEEIIIFGCNDGFVYCLKERKLHWKIFLHDRIVSTPFVELCPTSSSGSVLCFTTKGELFILNINNGEKLSHYSLPGEVFSSPILINGKIIIGCRDDNVYCLDTK